MKIILTSPAIQLEEISNWSRNLLGTSIKIDNRATFLINSIDHFQIVPEGDSFRVVALVELGTMIKEESNG